MLRKRIIFSFIYSDGFFHQSRNFRLQKVGNLTWLEKNYKFQKISFSLDELIVINASKDDKNITKFVDILNKLVDNVFIPIVAGGGIKTIDNAKLLFDNGADKIILNTAFYTNKQLIKNLVSLYGSQSIVASVDYKTVNDKNEVYINNGTTKIPLTLKEYLKDITNLNIGEVYLNSITKDGTGFGYDLKTIDEVLSYLDIPLFVSGGAGNENHLLEALQIDGIGAVSTANLFNFIGDGLPKAREKILSQDINIANFKGKNNETN